MKHVVVVVKIGGILAVIGTCIFVVFALLLVIYPVEKNCIQLRSTCHYISKAPEYLRILIAPYTLVFSLLAIAAGVGLFRFGSLFLRREETKTKYKS